MPLYEYKVLAAPTRGEKARGLKTPGERFGQALANVMNAQGREGWEYLRAETLPSEERSGLTRRSTVYHSVLVFRRPVATSGGDNSPLRPMLIAAPPSPEAPRIGQTGEGAAPRLGPANPVDRPT